MKKLLCGAYTQYTPSGKALFVKANRYFKEPQKGDVVYFYSAILGRVAHVGIVIGVTKDKIKTVEGNTSSGAFSRNGGEVAIKEYQKNNKRIDGYGRPVFSADTCTVDDFVNVALAEVGYTEKASNKELEGKLTNIGNKNFTKYGAWYGGNGLYWCQQFVSWCAYKACLKWRKLDDKWYYKDFKGEWVYIDGRWYVFDNQGAMIKGWFKHKDDWYYLAQDGAMVSGQWLEYKNNWYYLDKTGLMVKNCYVKYEDKYCWINSDGIYDKKWDTKEPNLEKFEIKATAIPLDLDGGLR